MYFSFWRIYKDTPEFWKLDECLETNLSGTKEVFKFCLKYKIKLVYSATSASLGKRVLIKIFHLMLLQNQKT